jgi:hypothetical protein
MPKTKISEFSATPANNTDIDSINIAEGCAPSGINDAIRELMAQLKDFQTGAVGDSFNGPIGTTTAAAGAFTTLSSTGNTTLGDASGDAITVNGTATFANANPTLTAGTANGVTYLNGSKVLTSGSALTYSATSGLTTNGVTQGYNTTLYTVDGTLSNYSAANNVYLNGNTAGGLNLRGDGTGGASTQLFLGGATSSEASKIIFTVANSEGMRLTSTGLGIGTSSPVEKLTVQSTGNSIGSFRSSGASYVGVEAVNSSQAFSMLVRPDVSNALVFRNETTSTNQLILNTSGNLGLGVTPSAWASGSNAIQNSSGSIWRYGTDNIFVGQNYYFNGSNRIYSITAAATEYRQNLGSHIWYNAPSGTAGNTISFTQAMTLDASGNLGVGTTTPDARLDVTRSGNGQIAVLQTGTNRGFSFESQSDTALQIASIQGSTNLDLWANTLSFSAGGSERARIDSSGNLLVGKTASGDTTLGIQIMPSGITYFNRSGSTNADTTLHVYSTGAAAYRFYVGMGGTVYATSTTISAISDIRYKENVRDLDVGLDAVMALKPRLYDWKEGKGADIKNARGFIAQEFEEVFPDLIDEWKDPAPEGEAPYKSVRQDLIPVLVKAIQEQQALIQSLKARLDAANL